MSLGSLWDDAKLAWTMPWKGTKGAGNICIVDPTTGSVLGIQSGGLKVANVYEPARDVFISWLFGGDAVASVDTLTANVLASSVWQDQSLINGNLRSIVIVNGDPAPTYAWALNFSRNGLGVATDDTYPVTSSASAARAQILQIPLPVSLGFDRFLRLDITPAVGQAGNQLKYKAYLIGRGG